MAEGDAPSPEIKPQSSPEKEFNPSWLVKTQEEFDKLRKGQVGGTPGKRIAMLHSTGLVNTLNPDQLADRVAQWGEEAVDEGDDVMEQAGPYLIAMTEKVQEMREGKKEQKSKLDEAFPAASKAFETIGPAVAGAVLAEGIDLAQEAVRRVTGRGGASSQGPQQSEQATPNPSREKKPTAEKDYSEMTYSELERLDLNILTAEQKTQVKQEKDKLINGLSNFDGGRFLERVQREVKNIVRENSWDNVYDKLVEFVDNEEAIFKRTSDDDPRWEGMLRAAVYAEAANLSLQGIKNELARNPTKVDPDWLSSHDYNNKRLNSLREDAAKRIPQLNLLPADSAELVGKRISKRDESYTAGGGIPTADEMAAMDELRARMGLAAPENPEERYVPIQAPGHVGAAFKGGLFNRMFRHATIPDKLDIKDPKDRTVFILENLHAFNSIFKQPGAWLQASETWLNEVYYAARQNNLSETEKKYFEKLINAAVAATSSARAMEKSNGSIEAYGIWLTTGGQGREADLDVQDQLKDKIIHEGGREKLNILLNPNFPVRKYYDELLKDMQMEMDIEENEEGIWVKGGGPAIFVGDVRQMRSTSETDNPESLIYYLKNTAKNGGFENYIRKVLLKGIEENTSNWDVQWAAARLACDIVMVDGSFTEWEWQLTNGKDGEGAIFKKIKENLDTPARPLTNEQQAQLKQELKNWERLTLFPTPNSGGDPLKSIKKPSMLPGDIKGAFADNPVGQLALEYLNRAFAPEYIYNSLKKDEDPNNPNAENRWDYAIKPTMTTNWKAMARWGRAHWNAIGGSQAEGLGGMDKESLGKVMADVYLLNQLTGSKTEKGVPVGKHILGAQLTDLLVAKTLAYIANRPTIFGGRISSLFGDPRNHPNGEIVVALFGPEKVSKTGLLRDMRSSTAAPIFKNNIFKTESLIVAIKKALETNDPKYIPIPPTPTVVNLNVSSSSAGNFRGLNTPGRPLIG